MRIEIIKNFLSQNECKQLNEWVCLGIDNKWLDIGITDGKWTSKRLTSRLYGHRYQYPQLVKDIFTKIREKIGISNYSLIKGQGKNGVVVSCTFNGGDVYAHKDSKSSLGLSALRCNIMTQATESGAKLFLEEQEICIESGDLHCYLASDFEHYVTTVKGDTPRILWMFGVYVPFEDWESGKIKVN